MGRRGKYSIPGQHHWRLAEMLESPAYRVLSLSAHRVIDRIAIEHSHHGGQENGRLPVTYDNFVEYGIDRHAIAPAIREAVALGFIEVTERGRPGAGEFRSPNLFRITYQPIHNRNKPVIDATDEWRKIQTIEQAVLLQKAARAASDQRVVRRARQHQHLRVVP